MANLFSLLTGRRPGMTVKCDWDTKASTQQTIPFAILKQLFGRADGQIFSLGFPLILYFYMKGVTVLNTSSFHVYTEVLALQ